MEGAWQEGMHRRLSPLPYAVGRADGSEIQPEVDILWCPAKSNIFFIVISSSVDILEIYIKISGYKAIIS